MLNSLPQWQSAEGPLRRFVLGFWQGGRAVEQGETFRILPDGSLDLAWALGASSIAYGTTTRPRDAALAEGALYFGVRFRPGTAHRFLDLVGLAQLTDCEAPCVLRHDRDLASRLAEAQSFEERVALVAAQLGRLAAEADAADLSEAAARMIAAQGGRVRIEDLASKLGVTRRHLERACRRDLGLSPKMLARITRFRRAASLLSGGAVCNGADLAAAGGYVDQAHLIRQFQEFAGTTPRLFRA
jgi:AraC-like DNA-binding protein